MPFYQLYPSHHQGHPLLHLVPQVNSFLQKLPQIFFLINENANLRCVIEGQDSRMNHFSVLCFDFSLMSSSSEKLKRLEIMEE